MKQLVYFIHECEYGKVLGGVERRFLGISAEFSKLGLESYVIELSPSLSASWVKSDYHLTIAKSKNDRGPRFLSFVQNVLHLTWQGLKIMREEGCDLVYVTRHDFYENVIPAYLVSRVARIPLVIVCHHVNPKDLLSTKQLFITARKAGLRTSSAAISLLKEWVPRLIIPRCDLCFVVSESSAREFKRVFGVQRVRVVGNGIDLPDQEIIAASSTKKYAVAFCGRMEPYKGTDTLIRAWQLIVQKCPKAKLVMIGAA
ncbi:MAG: glycosyltransferase family 4 protein, partial [Rhabdochlamydiaceae bacterium]